MGDCSRYKGGAVRQKAKKRSMGGPVMGRPAGPPVAAPMAPQGGVMAPGFGQAGPMQTPGQTPAFRPGGMTRQLPAPMMGRRGPILPGG